MSIVLDFVPDHEEKIKIRETTEKIDQIICRIVNVNIYHIWLLLGALSSTFPGDVQLPLRCLECTVSWTFPRLSLQDALQLSFHSTSGSI